MTPPEQAEFTPGPHPINVADVYLTEGDIKTALADALNAKKSRVAAERSRTQQRLIDAQWDALKRPDLLWNEMWRRGELMASRKSWEQPFQIPEHLQDIAEGLCLYFAGHPSAADFSLSLNKGILLHGKKGTGKSTLLELFQRNALQPYTWVPTYRVVSQYQKPDNQAATLEFFAAKQKTTSAYLNGGREWLGFCFDDLGAEPVASNYGKNELMIQILDERYDTCRGPLTHITTNLSVAQIEKRYTSHTLDRFYEMFNLIEVPEAESMRQ